MSRLSPNIALNAEALLQKAAAQTGLSDFGDDAFREPYELLLQSLRDEARLNKQGVIMLQRTILRLLVNRLLTEQAFAANPEMAETPIERPLYILGFPRTGTTLLHNLLSRDPAARWLRLWEGLHPAPPPESLEDDPRIAQTEEFVAGFEKIAPRLASAHKLNATGPEECLWLIEHTFADFIFELRANIPSYSDWLAGHEADAVWYRYYRRQLQMLSWKCRGIHWVCKAPRHLPGLGGLLSVLPDARIVQTHRGECSAKHLQPVRDHAQRRKRCGGQGRHRRALASAPARDRAAIERGSRRRRSGAVSRCAIRRSCRRPHRHGSADLRASRLRLLR